MIKKLKFVVSNYTVFKIINRSKSELEILDRLSLYAPYQMETDILRRISKKNIIRQEKLMNEYNSLIKKINFITVPNSENTYEECLKKVKSLGIWDNEAIMTRSHPSIPYFSTRKILLLIEEISQKKEDKILSISDESSILLGNTGVESMPSSYHNPEIKPYEYLSIPEIKIAEDNWSPKNHDEDVFSYVNNYFVHEGLLCLTDGIRRYLVIKDDNLAEDEKPGEILENVAGVDVDNIKEDPKPPLPDINNAKKVIIVEIDKHDSEEYVYIVENAINTKSGKIGNYWETIMEYSEDENRFDYISEDKFDSRLTSVNLDSEKEEGSNNSEIKKAKDDYNISDKYEDVLKESGCILVIDKECYLLSPLYRIFSTLSLDPESFPQFEDYYRNIFKEKETEKKNQLKTE